MRISFLGLLLVSLVGGCRPKVFEARAYLVNRTDRDLLVETRGLDGNCQTLWEHGDGFIREDDFAREAGKARLPPNTVLSLGACAVRIAIGGVREDLTWDPSLPTREIHDPPQADELDDHRQMIDVLAAGNGLTLQLSREIRRMTVLPADAPSPPSSCAEAGVQRLGFSTIGRPTRSPLTAIEERDGCLALHMAAPKYTGGPQPARPDLGSDDAGLAEEDAGVPPLDVPTQPASVYVCMPRELYPFAVGNQLTVTPTAGTRPPQA